MPRGSHQRPTRLPNYREHKGSGQAVVTLSGKDHYLGVYQSPESWEKYYRLTGEWVGNGRRLRAAEGPSMTIGQLVDAFLVHAASHYRKKDHAGIKRPTGELTTMRRIGGEVKQLYGKTPVSEFGASAFKAVRGLWIERGICRRTCNLHAGRLRHIFRWGVSEKGVPPEVLAGLKAVLPLEPGRSAAPDHPEVEPVARDAVEAVQEAVRPHYAAMIEVMWLTGMRAGEAVLIREPDIDRSGAVWIYRPVVHKMQHKNKKRLIAVGPKAQAVLAPWFERAKRLGSPWAFSSRHDPKRHILAHDVQDTIRNACDRLGIPRWHSHQLRHAAGTRIRAAYGLDGSQVVLGHSHANTTEIYSDISIEKAKEIAAAMG